MYPVSMAAAAILLSLLLSLPADADAAIASSDAVVNDARELFPLSASSASVCEYYNQTCMDEAARSGGFGTEHCQGNQTCPPNQPHNCYTVWSNEPVANPNATGGAELADDASGHSSGLRVKMMGCFQQSDDCRLNEECLERAHNLKGADKNHLFCCCRGSMCNSVFSWSPIPTTPKPKVGVGKNSSVIVDGGDASGLTTEIGMIAAVASCLMIAVIAVIIACVVVYYKRKKAAASNDPEAEGGLMSGEGGGGDDMLAAAGFINDEVELHQIIAQSRVNGVTVYKGKFKSAADDDDHLAVKVFSQAKKDSWAAERDVFNLPRMKHEHILQFVGVQHKGENLNAQLWLMTKFHEKGSLCDFLKSNTVSFKELSSIAYSIASGLAHLHEELPSRGTLDMKPAVAHRDFKSKNVLVKSDMTACIGDFGLALIFEPEKPPGDSHGQVGTCRYMAPELLEGAIDFRRDSFLRIDMYAAGLVLWELASRCREGNDGQEPEEYKLPFQEETLRDATREQMQALVVERKARPKIPEAWERPTSCLSDLVRTIRDCWDQDAEARLSASNVKERIKAMRETLATTTIVANDGAADGLVNNVSNNINGGTNNANNPQQLIEANLNQRNIANNAEEHEMAPLIIDPRNGSPPQIGGGGTTDA